MMDYSSMFVSLPELAKQLKAVWSRPTILRKLKDKGVEPVNNSKGGKNAKKVFLRSKVEAALFEVEK